MSVLLVMAQLELEVVTPERRVLSEPVDMVTVPGLGGELGILPGQFSYTFQAALLKLGMTMCPSWLR